MSQAKAANINLLFVQVRRRGDALYRKSIDPPLDDPAYDPDFDALEFIVELAHREGIQVHAWANAMLAWHGDVPPRDPGHVFNRHGLSRPAVDNWLTVGRNGKARFPAGYFLDPGHPAAAAYLTEVYLNIVRNYAVDGLHLDYVRYPETGNPSPRGSSAGYNPVSLARFQRATGRMDIPAPEDEQWVGWRRVQVTQLVRRVYLEAKAVNPRIRVSAATIAWGRPPDKESDFLNTSAGGHVFQDWNGWLKEGILDLAVPMNYAREADPTVRKWFDGWIRWEKRHKHDRQVVVGIGTYLNSKQANLAQIARALKPELGKGIDGIAFFSYASPFCAPVEAMVSAVPAETVTGGPERGMEYLAAGAGSAQWVLGEPLPDPATDRAIGLGRGHVAGRILGTGGSAMEGTRIRLRRAGWWPFRRSLRGDIDGNGYFGFPDLSPGRYEIRVGGAVPSKRVVEVDRGSVSRVTLGE